MSIYFDKMVFQEIGGTFFRVPHKKDYIIFGSILGPPIGKLVFVILAASPGDLLFLGKPIPLRSKLGFGVCRI